MGIDSSCRESDSISSRFGRVILTSCQERVCGRKYFYPLSSRKRSFPTATTSSKI